MSAAHMYVQDPSGGWVPFQGGLAGSVGGGSSSSLGGGNVAPSGAVTVAAPWAYAAASGGITDTSDATLIAAPGAGKSNYLKSLQIMNSSATATEVVIKSGSTVLWRTKVGASMIQPVAVNFAQPLIGANNTALTAACITTATATYISAQGYQDVSLEALIAGQTPGDEVFDQAGNLVLDQAGATVYQ